MDMTTARLYIISIHAPPRGATSARSCEGFAAPKFQFTPLREGRHNRILVLVCKHIFQFTPLREGRQHKVSVLCASILFQFTPLREGRQHKVSVLCASILFQFTPLREGRRLLSSAFSTIFHFNSRPSARGDPTDMHLAR